MDIYTVASQLKAIELMPSVQSFFYDNFCTDLGAVEDDMAIWDFYKGVKKMAPFVKAGTGGIVMKREPYETRKMEFPNIAPERIVEGKDLATRSFGENVLGAMTPEQREKKMLAKDIVEMREAIQLRREWMVREVLLKGELKILRYTNEGRDVETTMIADYGFTNHYTPATAWNKPGAKIQYDMERMLDLVQEGLGTVGKIVMSPDVWDAMLSNETFLKSLDLRNADMSRIKEIYKGEGIRFLGYNQDQVEMYSCAGKFLNDDGEMEMMMPSGTILFGDSDVVKCVHGPVTQVEEEGPKGKHTTYIKKEVPLRHASINGNNVMTRLTSRPTIIPFNVDGWAVGHVI